MAYRKTKFGLLKTEGIAPADGYGVRLFVAHIGRKGRGGYNEVRNFR